MEERWAWHLAVNELLPIANIAKQLKRTPMSIRMKLYRIQVNIRLNQNKKGN